jgi:large subunit ribosomal protein L11
VVITVFTDKSFTFILKSPPASVLLKKAANIASGSAKPNQDKVGKVTKKQLLEIYNIKKNDMNATTPEAGIKVIAGTARNMGIEVID